MDPILKVKELSVEYKTAYGTARALQKVSFTVEQGEIMGIVGESGSGKSTLGLSILGLLPENAAVRGEILLRGQDIFSLNPARLRLVRGRQAGMVFQAPASSFNPVLSIEYQFREVLQENLAGKDRKKIPDLMNDFFRKVRLPDPQRILKSYPHQLSGGQLQRVALAMALATGPRILIADEPTSSLDVTVESQIINLLRQLKNELDISIVFITHNLDLVEVLCDRVCVLYKGVVREIKTKNELFQNPADDYTRELLRSLRELA